MLLGSFSFVGHRDDGRDPAAALRRARGADDVRPPVVPAARVSGVYYSVEILPEWMQVLSQLSPATYVLDGVRAGLIDGVPVTELVVRHLAADRDGHRAHPVRPVGLRPRRALRQAHRQAQAGRADDDRRPIATSDRRASAGTRVGRRPSRRSRRRAAARPGRRRPQGDLDRGATPDGDRGRRSSRAASASRRSAPSDYPAVGDWVALEPAAGGRGQPTDPAVIAAVLPRRSAFRRSAADSNRRTAGLLADEQVLAANVDVAFLVAGLDGDFNLRRLERYLAVAWSSGVDPGDRAQQGRRRRRPRRADASPIEAIAPGVPIVTLSALTGDHLADLARRTCAPGRTAVVLGLVGRRQVDARQRAPRRGAPGAPPPSARTTRAAATRPPTASCSGCRAARCSSTPRASARSGSPAPTRASTPRSTTSPTRGRRAGSATAATRASRAARSGPRSPTAG